MTVVVSGKASSVRPGKAAGGRIAGVLSDASNYEQMFGTRHRRSGRPVGSGAEEVVFGSDGVHPLIARLAARRAYAVLHERYKDELARLYEREKSVLSERGTAQVALDAGLIKSLSDWKD